MIGDIILAIIFYIILGLFAVLFSVPPKNCSKKEKKKLFFLIIFLWPYCLVYGIGYIFKEMVKNWLK